MIHEECFVDDVGGGAVMVIALFILFLLEVIRMFGSCGGCWGGGGQQLSFRLCCWLLIWLILLAAWLVACSLMLLSDFAGSALLALPPGLTCFSHWVWVCM